MIIRYSFLTIQTILYVIFLALDFTGGNSNLSANIKYMVILLCFIYTLMKWDAPIWKRLCMRSAFFFTLVADYFLLLKDRHYLYGILSFIIVQQLYGIKLDLQLANNRTGGRKNLIVSFLWRLLLQIIAAVLICTLLSKNGITLDRIGFTSIYYFICIITNVLRAILIAKLQPAERSNRIYAVGMILFLLCDINVGLYNLSQFLTLQSSVETVLYTFSSILMWAFYAPSQVLIALSIACHRHIA